MFKILSQVSKLKLFLFNLIMLVSMAVSVLTPTMILIIEKIDVTNLTVVLLFGLVFSFLYILNSLMVYLSNYVIHSICKDFIVKISQKAIKCFYNGTLKRSADWLNSLLSQDMDVFWSQYLAMACFICVNVVIIIFKIGYILIINLPIGIIFVLCSFLLFLPHIIFKNILKNVGETFEKTRQNSLSTISDFAKGANTVRSNQAGNAFTNWVFKVMNKNEDTSYQYYIRQDLASTCSGPFKGLGYLIPIVIALWTISSTNLSIAKIVALMTATEILARDLSGFYGYIVSMRSATAFKDKMLEIINIPDEEIKTSNIKTSTSSLSIKVENLNKNYDDKTIFANANAQILAGEKVLLSGVSGSGKTTLFSLLCGEDKDFQGNIYFENEAGEKYLPSYDNVSLIHQTPYIFSTTLKENVTLFEEYSDEEVIEVLKKVHLWDELGRDLNTVLNGSNLSGGQVMKLEIARSFLRLRPIVLADEVTAALDKDNSQEIRKLLYSLDATLIEIAHKYNIEDYNYVYRLENNGLVRDTIA